MVLKWSSDGGGLEKDTQMNLVEAINLAIRPPTPLDTSNKSLCADDILQVMEEMLLDAERRYHAEHAAGGEILDLSSWMFDLQYLFEGVCAVSYQRLGVGQIGVIHSSHGAVGGWRGSKWRQLS